MCGTHDSEGKRAFLACDAYKKAEEASKLYR